MRIRQKPDAAGDDAVHNRGFLAAHDRWSENEVQTGSHSNIFFAARSLSRKFVRITIVFDSIAEQ
jgi:hypothetical protein